MGRIVQEGGEGRKGNGGMHLFRSSSNSISGVDGRFGVRTIAIPVSAGWLPLAGRRGGALRFMVGRSSGLARRNDGCDQELDPAFLKSYAFSARTQLAY